MDGGERPTGSTRVDATVADGRCTAWWPEGTEDGSGRLSSRVTLRDGTVLQDPLLRHEDDGR